MRTYYNEHDPYCAQWLRNLIAAGEIANGEVDERSIADVQPADLVGYDRCHFFAGIAGWDLALRLAGWPSDWPVWTGSCPCQTFSVAGKGDGQTDPRDLWPTWFRLIGECRPPIIFGEQVAGAIGHGWLDRLCDDLEGEGYAVGAAVLPACSVGAPHLRQRLWWVAQSSGAERRAGIGLSRGSTRGRPCAESSGSSPDGVLADAEYSIRGSVNITRQDGRDGTDSGRPETYRQPRTCGEVRGMADADGTIACNGGIQRGGRLLQPAGDSPIESVADTLPAGRPERGTIAGDGQTSGSGAIGELVHAPADRREIRGNLYSGHDREGLSEGRKSGELGHASGAGLAVGSESADRCGTLWDEGTTVAEANPWRDLIWIPCRDGKARPTQSPIQWMADGLSELLGYCRDASGAVYLSPLIQGTVNRVGRLRGYGNAISPQLAAQFIGAYVEIRRHQEGRCVDPRVSS